MKTNSTGSAVSQNVTFDEAQKFREFNFLLKIEIENFNLKVFQRFKLQDPRFTYIKRHSRNAIYEQARKA